MMRFNFFKKQKEEPVKVLELFGGIGACTQAFKRIGIPFEVVDYVEIDKYACKSYNAINGTDFKPQDICEWDKDIKVDFIMHGSPCQDFSVAGKGLGGDEGSGTRSSLMYETIRIVEKLKPKYVLWENVKNVTGKKHRHNFDKYLVSLQQLGYNNYWQIMNAKDYGIPQNRERVFVLSIRRDIDKGYEFPEPFPLKLRLKDMLDAEVDEKFYLSNKGVNGLLNAFVDGREHKPNLMTNETEYSPTIDTRVGSQTHRSPYIDESDEKFYLDSAKEYFIKHSFESEEKGNGFRFEPHVKKNANVAKTVTTRAGGRMDDNFVMDVDSEENTFKFDSTNKMIQVGQMYGTEKEPNPQAGRIYSADGTSPTIDSCSGGNRMPKVAVAMRGRYNAEGELEQQLEISDREYANSITTVQKDSMVAEKEHP